MIQNALHDDTDRGRPLHRISPLKGGMVPVKRSRLAWCESHWTKAAWRRYNAPKLVGKDGLELFRGE